MNWTELCLEKFMTLMECPIVLIYIPFFIPILSVTFISIFSGFFFQGMSTANKETV